MITSLFSSRRPVQASALVFAALLGAQTLSAQATTGSTPAPAPGAATRDASIFDEEPTNVTGHPIPDKVEGFNRAMFKFNDGFYNIFLRPVSKGYSAVVPRQVRIDIGNFFHNLAFPTRFAGNLFEGHLQDATTEAGRFVVNTLGGLGFFDVADWNSNLPEKPSDLGQAFGTWGIGHGSYLVLPLLGPSSIRDGIGLGLSEYFLDPVSYLHHWEYRYGADALLIVNESKDQLRAYDQLKAAAIDPYVSLRDAYASQRARHVTNGLGAPVEAPPPPPPAR